MGRPHREHEPGSVVHAIAVGNNKGDLFFRDPDRVMLLAMVERLSDRSDWLLLSYCLMTTHAHFVFRVGEEPLAATLQILFGGYARTFNRQYGRVGHLFKNRYFGVIARTDAHALELCRYVALNPVRAGLRARPQDWPWSSYAATVGLARPIPFVASEELLALFDVDRRRARAAYRAFVEEGIRIPRAR